jgi:hypothetical protein
MRGRLSPKRQGGSSVAKRTEIRDGKEYEVTVLPPDRRLEPWQTKNRNLWGALKGYQKVEAMRQIRKKKRQKSSRPR